MKASSSVLLLALVLICFSGIQSYSPNEGFEIDCSSFPQLEQGDLACTREYVPLCGTDGNNYANPCDLCNKQLKQKTNIGVKHRGICQGKKLDCGPVSVACTMEYQPHCASDGQTYSNKCLYCNAQSKNPELTLLAREQCSENKVQ
ncbi:serine protease inhibitor Kazal-type 6-like [Discoglossus pictus]